MSDYELKRAALRKANQVRRALDLPPVDHMYKGYRVEPRSCPITNTIYDDDLSKYDAFIETNGDEIFVEDYRGAETKIFTFKTPIGSQVRRFIRTFDNGAFPELDAQNKDTE